MELAEFFVKYVQQFVPTWLLLLLIRLNMRFLVGWRMRSGDAAVQQILCDRKERTSKPVTEQVEVTNEQLYANDPDFFVEHLGPRLKYSACEWPATGTGTLAEAETLTVSIYQELAGLAKLPAGSRVLELGCGWGSLSLANAERFPKLTFVSFSNSPQQIGYVRDAAAKLGLKNLTAFVEDYSDFVDPAKSKVAPAGQAPFDAAIAIETIEHAQNIRELLSAVSARLRPGGKLFVQSLLHQTCSYVMSGDTWMGRNFFTAGSIIALNSYFHLAPPDLYIAEMKPVSGIGYSKTLLAWLRLQEQKRAKFVGKYGTAFYEGFRMFYISCAEAFAANDGNEFMCGYYTFVKRG